MPEDYTTSYNNKRLQEEAAKQNESVEEDKSHRITKHQIFTKNGEKQVYHVDHDAGKVYVEGDRGLLRYSSNNLAEVSAYPPFDDSVQAGAGYLKNTTPGGIVTYTTLDGQPYTPQDNDIEYSLAEDGTYKRVGTSPSLLAPEGFKEGEYQRHKSVNGQTYYTDSNGNKVVKGDIPEHATITDVEDKE